MQLNDLFAARKIDPKAVIIFRHRPTEPKLYKMLPRLAAERPELYNAYQQTQSRVVENAMKTAEYVASFIGHEPRKALFVGLYSIGVTTPMTVEAYWQHPAYRELKSKYDIGGFAEGEDQTPILWFDLNLTDFYANWKGKLVVDWPPPERSWWRRAHRNEVYISSILEQSALDPPLPVWHQIVFTFDELGVLSSRWKSKLSEWRAIYYIRDISDGRGYVGSAYGEYNLLGRWSNYATLGHGGNKLLRNRDPRNFRFSILQRLDPDLDAESVVAIENSWKIRLHTRQPEGLNDN
jgi:hypothetical protein